MELRKGYKETEVGLIPSDWKIKQLAECIIKNPDYGINAAAVDYDDTLPTYLRITDISEDGKYISKYRVSVQNKDSDSYYLQEGDIVFARTGASVGKTYLYKKSDGKLVFAGFLIRIKVNSEILNPAYFFYHTQTKRYWSWVAGNSMRSGQPGINSNEYKTLLIPLPKDKAEQTAIATALSDMDNLIAGLEKLIEKKKAIKQGAMQELLRPKEGWVVKKLGDIVDVLDNLRVPLNDNQRSVMKGDIPYCGANGIVDYVNDYIINEDIILMAEDGGFFDEYKTRPIAYRMTGKCWVNNHAHILKAKNGFDQGFVFFSLVHKNILDFINGGTRAKLNKSDLLNIEVLMPNDIKIQSEIATVLDEIENEIILLGKRYEKNMSIKSGMMQELLTGKTRLV